MIRTEIVVKSSIFWTLIVDTHLQLDKKTLLDLCLKLMNLEIFIFLSPILKYN